MTREALTLAAEAFSVVGLSDVVFRSLISLIDLASRAASASSVARGLLGVLKSLAQAIAEVRAWAVNYEQSVLSTADGQRVPKSLETILCDCQKQIDVVRQALHRVEPPGAGAFSRWITGTQFAWNEQDIRQSISLLSSYTISMQLLIASRTGTDITLLRREQLVAHEILSDVQANLQSQNETITYYYGAAEELSAATMARLDHLQRHQLETTTAGLDVLERVDETTTAMQASVQKISEQISSLYLREFDETQVLVEGHNMDAAIGALQAMNHRLSFALESLSPNGSLIVPESAIDWLSSELDTLLQYAYRSASAGGREYSVSGLDFELTRRIHTIPIRQSAFSRDQNGFMTIELADGIDASARRLRRIRFACFSTGFSQLGSGVIGLITKHWPTIDGSGAASFQVNRQIRVLNIRPSNAKAFQYARENNVLGLQQLFTSGEASVLDYDQSGLSLLAFAAKNLCEDAAKFLLDAGADPTLCRLQGRNMNDIHGVLWERFLRRHQTEMHDCGHVFRRAVRISAMAAAKGVHLHTAALTSTLLNELYSTNLSFDIGEQLLYTLWHSDRRPIMGAVLVFGPHPLTIDMMSYDIIRQCSVLAENPNATDAFGNKPLHIACSSRCAKWISQHNQNFDTELLFSERYRSIQALTGISLWASFVRFILKQGVDVNARNKLGKTALMEYTKSCLMDMGFFDLDVLHALIEAGASVDMPHPGTSQTVLLAVAEELLKERRIPSASTLPNNHNLFTFFKTLLDAGANPWEVQPHGVSVADLARESGIEEVVALISSYGVPEPFETY